MLLTRDDLKAELKSFFAINDASLIQSQENTPFECINITLDLSSAVTRENPYKLGFPYKTVYVASTTDTSCNVNFIPDSNDTYQSAIPLTSKDVLNFDLPKAKGYLYWDAQVGKSMTIILFVKGNFKSGSYLTQYVGGSVGALVAQPAASPYTIGSGAVVNLLPYDTTRVNATYYNDGPNTAYLGGTSVTALNGIPLPVGAYYETKSQASWNAITASGTTSIRVIKET